MGVKPGYLRAGDTPRDGWINSWTLDFGSNTDGEGVPLTANRDRSIQVTGTLGGGGSVRIEGSNDGGVTWCTLHDPFGVALNITSIAEAHAVLEPMALMRPRVTAGDGTTAVGVYLFSGAQS